MKLSQNINITQEQRLTLTPQLIQAVQILQLPLLDLRAKIEEELMNNPALEIRNEKENDPLLKQQKINEINDNDNYNSEGSNETQTNEIKTENQIDTENDVEYELLFDDTYDPQYQYQNNDYNESDRNQFIEGTISEQTNLHQHLLWQLNLQPITKKEIEIGQNLINNLNENGFFIEPLDKLFTDEDKSLIQKMISMIQSFDPLGVCTADMQESLIIQAKQSIKKNKLAVAILENHYDLLIKRKDKEIARLLGKPIQNVNQAIMFISNLEPYPGRQYNRATANYVIPDAFVYQKEGQFIVEINDDLIPELGVNRFFKRLLQKTDEKKTVGFVKDKLNNANQFINAVKQRKKTLIKVLYTLIEMQSDFFHKGKKYLNPLTMREVAEKVNLAISTISRLVNSKYIQTEWGIFSLKYFFSSSLFSRNTNKSVGSASVKELIQEIIEKEKSVNKKLSDQKITQLLANKGIKIARRTVAKYRKTLNILPSNKRIK